jgi:hypothetical protein
VSFAAITLCVASQRVFIFVSVYFVIDSVRKLLLTHSYTSINVLSQNLPEDTEKTRGNPKSGQVVTGYL